MSGTFCTLTPCGHGVSSPAGVIHWCGVPSLIHGVMPPCKCRVARLSLKQAAGFGLCEHSWFRTPSVTVPSSAGGVMVMGTMPAPIIVESVGRNRSPLAPVGSRLRKTMRTGRSLVALMNGPSHCGVVTPMRPVSTFVPSSSSLTSGTRWLPGTPPVSTCTYPRTSVGGRSALN